MADDSNLASDDEDGEDGEEGDEDDEGSPDVQNSPIKSQNQSPAPDNIPILQTIPVLQQDTIMSDADIGSPPVTGIERLKGEAVKSGSPLKNVVLTTSSLNSPLQSPSAASADKVTFPETTQQTATATYEASKKSPTLTAETEAVPRSPLAAAEAAVEATMGVTTEVTTKATEEATAEATTDAAKEAAPEATTEATAEAALEVSAETAAEAAVETAAEVVAEATVEITPETAAEITAETAEIPAIEALPTEDEEEEMLLDIVENAKNSSVGSDAPREISTIPLEESKLLDSPAKLDVTNAEEIKQPSEEPTMTLDPAVGVEEMKESAVTETKDPQTVISTVDKLLDPEDVIEPLPTKGPEVDGSGGGDEDFPDLLGNLERQLES